ncbi:hypothetical protein [Wolbachia endosymbiont (group A) of Cydia splendana]|uniref:hypothetical protein n=2 Tax=Wolbachia TaxID=953 RepID=UPI0021F8B3C8|nr:hypothetical protein [Wolbachia endosymbiont (group A) of Cydia splendana]
MSGHWDDTIGGYLDDKKRSTGMTAVLRHTAAVSLDPANKQRDDGCQGVMKVADTGIQKKRNMYQLLSFAAPQK